VQAGLPNSDKRVAQLRQGYCRKLHGDRKTPSDVVGNVWNNREWYLSITSRQKPPWVIQWVFVACVTVFLFLVSSIPLRNALEEWLLLRGGVSLSSFPSQNWESGKRGKKASVSNKN